MSARWFAILAAVIGLLYIAVTPPFQVPDEWNHYVRAEAIAQGHVMPNMTPLGDCESFPTGVARFVRALYRTSGTFNAHELRESSTIRRDEVGREQLCFPAWYTPLPYAPQVAIAFASRIANVRPIVTFYTGRIANLAFALLLILAAMRAAPQYREIIAAITLLPMTMYELASWSADAPTYAIAVLLIAVLLRGRNVPAIALLALLLSLCKPGYFVIALLVFALPRPRLRAVAAVLLCVAIGVAISSEVAAKARFNARFDLHVDAREQLQCVLHDPARFAHVVANDLQTHGLIYVEEMVGRFGMTDVKLPLWPVWLEVALLVLVALAAARVSLAVRLLSLGIVLIAIPGMLFSHYLIWNVVCGPVIEGVQGRYFLPVAPLAALVLTAGVPVSPRVQRWLITGVAIVANATALFVLLQRYWMP